SRHHLRLTPSVTCLYPHHGLDRYLHSSPTRRSSDLERLGTINTWLFINGHVGDDTLVQAITTATEAKTRALHDLDIRDPISNTLATGTSTDSILVAATQSGAKLPYAGTATPQGQLIGKAIYQETKRPILRTRK